MRAFLARGVYDAERRTSLCVVVLLKKHYETNANSGLGHHHHWFRREQNVLLSKFQLSNANN